MLLSITGSSTRRDQLSMPTNWGEPSPFQLMKDSTATMTSGTRANRAKKRVAGRAQPKPGRPTSAACEPAGHREASLRNLAVDGELVICVVMSRSLGREGLHGLDEAVRVDLAVEELLHGLLDGRARRRRVRLVPGQLERGGLRDQVVLEA